MMYTYNRLIAVLLVLCMGVVFASDCHYRLLSGGPDEKSATKLVTSAAKAADIARRKRLDSLVSKPIIDPWTGRELIFEWPNEKAKVPHSTPSSPRPAAPAKKSGSF